MKEHPILFRDELVRAILDGRKTQTRRPVTRETVHPGTFARSADGWARLDLAGAWKDQGPSPVGNPGPYLLAPSSEGTRHRVYPRWRVGDRLWVRECWRDDNRYPGPYSWRADEPRPQDFRWKPSIHMPREACRLELELTAVDVEPVGAISHADALAEGYDSSSAFLESWGRTYPDMACTAWVWVLTFRRCEL